MVWAVGIMAPPVNPCPTRPRIIQARVCEEPQTTENTVNSTAQPSSRALRPNTRVSQAVSGIITISETR